jgi:hypothetical protein
MSNFTPSALQLLMCTSTSIHPAPMSNSFIYPTPDVKLLQSIQLQMSNSLAFHTRFIIEHSSLMDFGP